MKRIIPVALLLLFLCSAVSADIFQYVAKEDTSYKWEELDRTDIPPGSTKIELKLTSQTWQGKLLTHRIRLIKPQNVESPTSVFLLIAGSGGGRDELLLGAAIANGIGAPVAILHDVPYQPMFDGLTEDALISHTFVKMLETGDEEWPLLFSMTKTAVRAMDAIQEFCQEGLDLEVNGFVVLGGSKRGWTTWFAGVVDKRVKGIMPAVYDNLNLVRQMEHQLEAWGEYSEQIADYTRKGIPQQLIEDDGNTRSLSKLVDPYTYRERVTMPKLMVIGTNDRYWPLDALDIYYDDLVGDKYILYVPNQGHGVQRDIKRLIGNAVGFFLRVVGKQKFPELSWDYTEKEGGVELSIKSDIRPASVSIWTAEAPTRDFREVVWQESKIPFSSSSSGYSYILKKPEQGYAAVFGEAIYRADGKDFFLSTNVRILKAE